MRKLQLIQLEMAKEVKRICEKHQISYFLDAGTMLGAVRHGGFIPWDDDLDIGFLKEEYDRFLEAAADELNDIYYIQNQETDPEYGLSFSKLRLKGTVFVERIRQQNKAGNEIFIDLFPYINRSDCQKSAQKEARRFKLLTHIMMCRYHIKVWAGQGVCKRLKFLPVRLMSIFYSMQNLKKQIQELTALHKEENCRKVFIGEGTSAEYWYFDRDILEHTCKIRFEGELFPIPEKYDKYLQTAYGAGYMELPPPEKRVTHMPVKVDFGNY